MIMDGPVIDYGSSSRKRDGRGNSAADVREMDELGEAYARKKAEEGSMAGKTVSLDGFLKGKV